MKYKNYYLYVLICFNCAISFSQNKAGIQKEIEKLIPKEKTFIEINNEILVAGESLYYKFFCLLQNDNTLSNISKIAYVELIDNEHNKLFNHKIKLEKGIAYGDFFIPPNVDTGNYKLVGYTQWMNNNKTEQFFQKDIYIINPFISSTYKTEDSYLESNTSVVDIKLRNELLSQANLENNELNVDSKIYEPRSKAVLDLNGITSNGNYVLSIRKTNVLKYDSFNNKEDDTIINKSKEFCLPELRGEIISGQLFFKRDNEVAARKTITLSIPDKNYIYKNVLTDESGKFIFNLHENYSSEKCFLQVIDANPENFKIVLDDKSFKYENQLKFSETRLDSNMSEWLRQESVSNQVENAYNVVKLDSTVVKMQPNSFFKSSSISYKLDDYARFPTVRETFVEVVEGAAIRKKKDKYSFKIYFYEGYENYPFADYEPLVLFDGVLVQDNQYLIDYDPYKIDEVNLVKGSYFYGPKIFNGIIDIRTKKTNVFSANSKEFKGLHYLQLDLFQNKKIYYSPNYGEDFGNQLKRIPDYRRQLLWQPNITLNGENKPIEFYTSDVEGVYEVTLKGYTNSGVYLTRKGYFEVKNKAN